MIEVYLLKQGAQSATKLTLPATDYELLDALDKAGITNLRDIYKVEVSDCKLDYIPQFIPDSANLYELNIFAKQLAAMGEWDCDCFEGMVMMDAVKTDFTPITVERLINMTYSTSDCQIAGGVYDDEQLGRFYVENDFPVLPENLPEAVYDLLNYEEIGKQARTSEGGVFTPKGYVVHSGEMSRQYSSENLIYPQKPDYVFLLEIAEIPKGNESNDQNCVIVKLPCTAKTLELSLSEIGMDSIEGCCFYRYESTIPQLAEAFGFLEDIDQLNELAHAVTGFTKEQNCTYKAMLDAAPKDITISEALELSEQIQNFSVIREATSPGDYARHMLSKYSLPIPVIFEKEGVNTMESGGELLITILSSQAQEESRNISENTRWGVTRRFENGIVQVNHKKFLGYTKDEEGNLIIVPEEAIIVKRIFREYLQGSSIINIAKGLQRDGIKTVTGLEHWHPGTIEKMLSNEKFCGDACMQKTYTVDFLTKKKVKNDGYVRQYYIEDNHEAIIPKELFHQVQEEKLRRASLHKTAVTRKKNTEEKEKSKYSSKYILTDLMICAECGHAYRRQIWSKYGEKAAVWRCEDRLKQGKKSRCQNSPTIKESQLHDAIMTAINSVVENTGEFIGTFRENVIRVIGNYSTQGVPTEYDEQIEKLQQQMLTLIEDNAKQGAVSEDFDNEYKQLSEQINELKKVRIQMVQAQKKAESYKERVEQLDKTISTVNSQVREFDQDLVKRLISSIKVHKGMKLEIQFHSGIVLKQEVDYYE